MLTELDNVAEFEAVAPKETERCRDTPRLAPLRHESAGNEAAGAVPAIPGDVAGHGARSVLALHGLRDAVGAGWLSTYEIDRIARARRALLLGELAVATIRAVAAFARRARSRREQHRRAAAIREALYELDDHALHDLGFDRSEIASIAAEATGGAQRTRVRALSAWHGFQT